MKALVLGLLIIAVAIFAAAPFGLGWWDDVLIFLRGALPVMALFIGIIAVFIGAADIKDKAEAKKEGALDEKRPLP
ncbi:MAG: hypothetical protein LBQ88_09505 [Treponema sp.]|jgi:hypothetical protein|nr:hypothetical protein [Treponema sp.]